MTSSPRIHHGYSQRTVAALRSPARVAGESIVVPRRTRSSARIFQDPHDVTWWLHLVRRGVESDIARRGHLEAVMLRFQSGAGSRYLYPVPPDWRECSDVALWHYCEQAEP